MQQKGHEVARVDVTIRPNTRAVRTFPPNPGEVKPKFADPSRPLDCGVPEVHEAIRDRIMQAKKAAKVTNEAIGKLWGCTGQNASKRLRKPETLDPYMVDTLCSELRVTRECLQCGGDNGFGRYESPEFMAEVIGRLDPHDQETIWRVLKAMAGPIVSEVRKQRRAEEFAEWYRRHPQEYASVMQSISQTVNQIAGTQSIVQGMQAAIKRAMLNIPKLNIPDSVIAELTHALDTDESEAEPFAEPLAE